MLADCSPVVQALLGTLFTWGLTAAGAALVFIFSSTQKQILDGSLGFAAGVMLAASYWSLLAPAIEMAEDSRKYGAFAFLPVAIGFVLGAAFVYFADLMMPFLGVETDLHLALTLPPDAKPAKEKMEDPVAPPITEELSIRIDKIENGEVHYRRKATQSGQVAEEKEVGARPQEVICPSASSWRRIVLLILAITIHNIPEGLAVGVGFGAAGKTSSATFESARLMLGHAPTATYPHRPTQAREPSDLKLTPPPLTGEEVRHRHLCPRPVDHLKFKWLECKIPTGDPCVGILHAVEPLEGHMVQERKANSLLRKANSLLSFARFCGYFFSFPSHTKPHIKQYYCTHVVFTVEGKLQVYTYRPLY
ncbi:zinc transporter ZIP11-like isoform X2 [Neoarius graeffei]|uniref:zinc transporter ZIP11-like isoform X2 n=1 Tax=Neoarius graeffei TaxID=443677 RepID=UPI00298C2EB2|nr:zinc transporter ZIP11-like isoform X2 [Neoarius graeffei]